MWEDVTSYQNQFMTIDTALLIHKIYLTMIYESWMASKDTGQFVFKFCLKTRKMVRTVGILKKNNLKELSLVFKQIRINYIALYRTRKLQVSAYKMLFLISWNSLDESKSFIKKKWSHLYISAKNERNLLLQGSIVCKIN